MSKLDDTLKIIRKKYGARVANAFRASIDSIGSRVSIVDLTAAIDRGDIDAALDLLNITPKAFASLRSEVASMYNEAGQAVMAAIVSSAPKSTRAVLAWDVEDPASQAYLRNVLGGKITEVSTTTREAARAALSDGFAQGRGPRDIALDVVGRVGVNGKRSGGVLGLSGPQERYVARMRDAASNGWVSNDGNPAFWIKRDGTLGSSFSKRDRRFDKTILKMMRDGTEPTSKQVGQWAQRYSDRLLKLRGDTIARTETAAAQERSRMDAHKDALNSSGLPDHYTVKRWLHGGGGMKPRDSHVNENGDEVRGLEAPFILTSGVHMQYPHDPAAPASEVINCTCSYTVRIDWARARRDGLI